MDPQLSHTSKRTSFPPHAGHLVQLCGLCVGDAFGDADLVEKEGDDGAV